MTDLIAALDPADDSLRSQVARGEWLVSSPARPPKPTKADASAVADEGGAHDVAAAGADGACEPLRIFWASRGGGQV